MKTKIAIATFLPTTSRARHMDFLADLEKVVTAHKGAGTQVVISGPYHPGYVPEEMRGTDSNDASNSRTQRPGDADGSTGGERSERQRSAAADFAEPEPEPQAVEPAADAGKPAGGRKPRSDAGKPRGPRGGTAEASGTPAGQPGRGRGRGSAEGGDAPGGDGDGAASQGGERGGGRGRQADGGTGRRRGAADRADAGDEQAAPVAAADEDWGKAPSSAKAGADPSKPGIGGKAEPGPEFDTFEEEEAWWAKTPDEDGWPDTLMPEADPLTRADMSTLMGDHFRATGGKFKEPTFDILYEYFKADNLDEVSEDDYDQLARILLRDAAKYTYGVKKPVTTAPKK